MMRIKRILFPTDFSRCADQALDHALHFATRYGAALHMVHAIVLDDDDPHQPTAHFADIDEIHQRLGVLARNEMEAAVGRRPEFSNKVVAAQRRGFSPTDVILEYVKEEEIDLIVMGTRGRRGFGHLLLGSVAERVVRLASCPVLTIGDHERSRTTWAMKRILVPLDFSEHTGSLIQHAREIAAAYGARLELIHVIDDVPRPGFYDSIGFSLDVIEPDVENRAREEMKRLYEMSAHPGADVRYHAMVGRASEDIVGYATETGVDLIVIATHGLSGLRRLLMGSVAERVVQTAPCPVFTVKSFGKSLVAELPGHPSVRTGT